jgi:hypothetical protein
MTIFNTAFDTSAGSGFKITADRAAKQLQMAIIKVNFADNNRRIVGEEFGDCINPAATVLTNNNPEEVAVEPFPFPMLIDSPSKGKESESYVVFDGRPFINGNQLDESGQLKIRQRTEYDLSKLMTILTSYWCTNKYNDFKFLSKTPMGLYASLISETIARRFGLDPKDQLIISIVAAAFYSNLFNESNSLTENDKISITPNISSVTYAKSDLVFSTLDKVDSLRDLKDLVTAIKTTTQNPRMDDLNVGVLITILSGTWFGTNGKAIISAALEHPPTWVTLVYAAFTERSYKNSGLSKVADRYRGNKGEIEFSRAMKNLISKAKSGY